MTKNMKPGELPDDIGELPELTRELIIDRYLGRPDLVSRIVDAVHGVTDVSGKPGTFDADTMAALYVSLLDDDRRVHTVKRDLTKGEMAAAVCEAYDIDGADPYRDGFTKGQLIALLVELKTGDSGKVVGTCDTGKGGDRRAPQTMAVRGDD